MSTVKTRLSAFVCATAVAAFQTLALAAHPAEGGQPIRSTFYEADTSPRPSDSLGDLSFIGREDKPEWDQLSPMEQYMLGGINNRPGSGKSLLPWHINLYAMVSHFYEEFGYVPEVLTDVEVHQTPGFEEAEGVLLDQLRNPLTGEWPRLNAANPSPGDVYMRPLTDEEMRYFAQVDSSYGKHWFENLAFDSNKFAAGVPMDQCWTSQERLEGRPFYLRMYGRNGTILTRIEYFMIPSGN